VERRGAPVVAFARIAEPGDSDFVRQDIREPDHLLVLDPSLLGRPATLSGLKPGGWVVVNSPAGPGSLGVPPEFRVATVDAADIAVRHGLGSKAQPVVNTAILGAFVRATSVVPLEALLEAIDETVAVKTEQNRAAATEAHERANLGAAAHA
jgi:pyruvate ferredoxin oxidoreductase gamma subunit/2-oxoisovalerate ferredoxin oxidoreductase gamma subunit